MSGGVRIVSVGAPVESRGLPDVSAMAAALGAASVAASACVAIEDDEGALEAALDVTGVVVVIASAGGSAGDSVRRVLARITGARLRLHDRMRAVLDAHYAKRDRPLPRAAERLALLPQGATVAADDVVWTLESARTAWVVFLRGASLSTIDATVVPLVHRRLGARDTIAVRTFKTAGVALEEIEERLMDGLRARDVTLATLPGDGEAWVRLRARGRTPAVAARRLADVTATLEATLGADCYGRDGDTLEAVVAALLRKRGLTIAVAESCTGGLVAHRLTSVHDSSVYFARGVVADSNDAKQALLGVDEAILRTHGAVSAACAEAMARGACASAGAPCGLATTGIAGPDGAMAAKPAGTVFISLAMQGLSDVETRRFRFHGDRASVRWQASVMALDMLRRRLIGLIAV